MACCEDGTVAIVNWPRGSKGPTNPVVLTSFVYSVRSMISAPKGSLICSQSDGSVEFWSPSLKSRTYNILAEPSWQEKELIEMLQLTNGKLAENIKSALVDDTPFSEKHHRGGILHLKLSPNRNLLATCSIDKTCKIWRVGILWRDTSIMEPAPPNSDYRVRVEDILENYAVGNEAHVGEAFLPKNSEAELFWTFQHEGPVLCADFCSATEMLFTGSMDCTCRIWSLKRGNLIFQINTPSFVSHLSVYRDELYLVCNYRLLQFTFYAAKENDVFDDMLKKDISAEENRSQEREDYSMNDKNKGASSDRRLSVSKNENHALAKVISEQLSKKMEELASVFSGPVNEQIISNIESLEAKILANTFGGYDAVRDMNFSNANLSNSVNQIDFSTEVVEELTVTEIRALLAHGTLQDSAFDSFLRANPTFNASKLRKIALTYRISLPVLMRAMILSDYCIEEVLNLLTSDKLADPILGRIMRQIKNEESFDDILGSFGLRKLEIDDSSTKSMNSASLGEKLKWPIRLCDFVFKDEEKSEQNLLTKAETDEDGDDAAAGPDKKRPKNIYHYLPSRALRNSEHTQKLKKEFGAKLRQIIMRPTASRPPTIGTRSRLKPSKRGNKDQEPGLFENSELRTPPQSGKQKKFDVSKFIAMSERDGARSAQKKRFLSGESSPADGGREQKKSVPGKESSGFNRAKEFLSKQLYADDNPSELTKNGPESLKIQKGVANSERNQEKGLRKGDDSDKQPENANKLDESILDQDGKFPKKIKKSKRKSKLAPSPGSELESENAAYSVGQTNEQVSDYESDSSFEGASEKSGDNNLVDESRLDAEDRRSQKKKLSQMPEQSSSFGENSRRVTLRHPGRSPDSVENLGLTRESENHGNNQNQISNLAAKSKSGSENEEDNNRSIIYNLYDPSKKMNQNSKNRALVKGGGGKKTSAALSALGHSLGFVDLIAQSIYRRRRRKRPAATQRGRLKSIYTGDYKKYIETLPGLSIHMTKMNPTKTKGEMIKIGHLYSQPMLLTRTSKTLNSRKNTAKPVFLKKHIFLQTIMPEKVEKIID